MDITSPYALPSCQPLSLTAFGRQPVSRPPLFETLLHRSSSVNPYLIRSSVSTICVLPPVPFVSFRQWSSFCTALLLFATILVRTLSVSPSVTWHLVSGTIAAPSPAKAVSRVSFPAHPRPKGLCLQPLVYRTPRPVPRTPPRSQPCQSPELSWQCLSPPAPLGQSVYRMG